MQEKIGRHVAIIENDPDTSALLQASLQSNGFQTTSFGSGRSFLDVIDKINPDVCIVDIVEDGRVGYRLIERIASFGTSGTIIISGQTDPEQIISALERGADDFVEIPFEPKELVARVQALLRRFGKTGQKEVRQTVAIFGNWQIDFNTYQLSWAGDPRRDIVPEYLSHGEAAILRVFADTPNRIMTRTQILDQISDDPDVSFDRSVDVRISRLRSKIEENTRKPEHIKTVYGAGYIFVADVDWVE